MISLSLSLSPHTHTQLSSTVIIDAVTLQHIPKELNPTSEITSAPKTFKVLVCLILLFWTSTNYFDCFF